MVAYQPASSIPSSLTGTGGDGLVAARHLWHYGYQPTVFYPKQSKAEIYERLATQLKNLDVPFTEDFHGSLKTTDYVVDAIFGTTNQFRRLVLKLTFLRFQFFWRGARSFQGSNCRHGDQQSSCTLCRRTIIMEYRRRPAGIRSRGQIPSRDSDQSDCTKAACQAFHRHPFCWWKVKPTSLSLSRLSCITGLFDRFIPQSVAEKYDLDIPDYQGVDQIVEISSTGTESKTEKVIGLAERQG